MIQKLLSAASAGFAQDIIVYHHHNPDDNHTAFQALIQAARHGHADCIKTLFQCYPTLDLNACDGDGNTALMISVENGHSNCLEALFECSGSNLNVNQHIGFAQHTPLMWAAMHGQSAVIYTLHQLFPDIDPNLKTTMGDSALSLATRYNNPDCITTLGQCFPTIDVNSPQGVGFTPLMTAAFYGYNNCIIALHNQFPNIDVTIQHPRIGVTALMLAASEGYADSILTLFNYFPTIDANVKDNKKNATALTMTAKNGYAKCITQLRKCAANLDINHQAHDDLTSSLMYSAMGGHVECIHALCAPLPESLMTDEILTTVNPDLQDSQGRSALIWACQASHHDCIIALAKYFPRLDTNAQDSKRKTALIHAVLTDSILCVQSLLDHFPYVNVNVTDLYGKTALMMASSVGCMSLLLRCSTSPNLKIRCRQGKNVLAYVVNNVSRTRPKKSPSQQENDDLDLRLELVRLVLEYIAQYE